MRGHYNAAFPPTGAPDMAPPPLSGVVITRDEGDRIQRCLASLVPVCREVIVLDSGSTDDTVAKARAAGARVEHQEWLGYSSQKNMAIARATQPWVLLLDADEWLEPAAQDAVRAFFASNFQKHSIIQIVFPMAGEKKRIFKRKGTFISFWYARI